MLGAMVMPIVSLTMKIQNLKGLISTFWCGLWCFLLICAVAVNGYPNDYLPDEIIVKFKPSVPDHVIDRINSTRGAKVFYTSRFAGFKRLKIPTGKTVSEMVGIYLKNPNVEYAEPNYIVYATFEPNDFYYPLQWHFDNPVYGGIHLQDAWDIETGDSTIIIAVLDTGVAYETYGRFVQAPDLSGTSFVPGYNFIKDTTHPNDDHGHGTHVTGTIAQTTNNNIGVAGIAFNCSIMPVKVLNRPGMGNHAVIADGIYFATDNGAHVINMSLGGTASSITLENAVGYAYNQGVTIVCAAGNNGPGAPPDYPAAYDAYCIAVSATRYDETMAPYSNTGNYIDLAAPGGYTGADLNGDGYADGVIQQTFERGVKTFEYHFWQGTSMAAPHVSGVAALLISYGLSGPDNVRNVLETTAEDKGIPGWDQSYGWGIVDAYQALLSIRPTPPAAAPPGGSYNQDILVDLSASNAAAIYYTLDGSDPDTGSILYTTPVPISITPLQITTMTLKAVACNSAGNCGDVSINVYHLNNNDSDTLPDDWEQQIIDHDPADSITTVEEVIAFDDFDGDGDTNYDELLAGTDPVDPASYFRIISISLLESGVQLQWVSGPGRQYGVYWSGGLAGWNKIEPAVDSQGDSTTWSDTFVTTPRSRFYKVRLLP